MLMRPNKAETAVHGCLICPGDIFRACARGLLHLDVGVCEGLFFKDGRKKKYLNQTVVLSGSVIEMPLL